MPSSSDSEDKERGSKKLSVTKGKIVSLPYLSVTPWTDARLISWSLLSSSCPLNGDGSSISLSALVFHIDLSMVAAARRPVLVPESSLPMNNSD